MKICVLFLLLCAAAFPSRAVGDRSTEDALNEIDASGPTTTQLARDRVERAAGSDETKIAWLPLLSLFAPMLAAAAAVGVSGGIAGTFVLLRKESLLALAMPQVVAVGAAVGLRNHWPTLPPAIAAAAGALIFLVASRRAGSGPWVLPALYVAGLSFSFLIIAGKGQDVADLQKLFTGIDVAVAPSEAMVAVPLLLSAGTLLAILWRRWLLMAQAPAAAELAGLHPARWDALFLTLLTLILLVGTNVVGVVMVLAMLFMPAAAALPWARGVPSALVKSMVLSLVFLGVGFVVSNMMQWPLSQTIGAVGFCAVAVSQGARRICTALPGPCA